MTRAKGGENYVADMLDAEERIRRGERQRWCPTCERWRWREECEHEKRRVR